MAEASHLSVPSDAKETPLDYLNYLNYLNYRSFGRRFTPACSGHEG